MKVVRVLLLSGLVLGLGVSLGVVLGPGLMGGEAKEGGARVIDAGKYASLQEAFDAVPAEGGLVRLPPGKFELTQPLRITRGDVRVEGAGAATHLINRNQNGEPAIVIRPADRDKNRKARLWRVQLADFRISGNAKSGEGVRAEGINEIYLHGMSIDHNGSHGINLVDCYEDPRISDSILTYNGQAGLHILRGHDIVVSSNQFEENQDALHCVDSFNLCMTGNNLDDHLRHGVVIENTYGSVLSGNMIEECQGTAIILDRDCYGITLSANVIAHESGGGIHLKDAWGCAVSANTFTIVARDALTIEKDSGRITVTGNNFSNSYIGGKDIRMKQDLATGIVLKETADIAISGNVFTGLAGEAIRMEGKCPRVNVTGNVMADLFRHADQPGTAVAGEQATAGVISHNAIEEKYQLKRK